jgi:hypothetical protein
MGVIAVQTLLHPGGADVRSFTVASDNTPAPASATGTIRKAPAVDLDIDALLESQEENPGGLVVRNADGNDAPRKKIIIQPVDTSYWQGNLVLTKNSDKVRLFSVPKGCSRAGRAKTRRFPGLLREKERGVETTSCEGRNQAGHPGRLHHKSCSEKDFFEIGFIPTGGKAFVLDADLET